MGWLRSCRQAGLSPSDRAERQRRAMGVIFLTTCAYMLSCDVVLRASGAEIALVFPGVIFALLATFPMDLLPTNALWRRMAFDETFRQERHIAALTALWGAISAACLALALGLSGPATAGLIVQAAAYVALLTRSFLILRPERAR